MVSIHSNHIPPFIYFPIYILLLAMALLEKHFLLLLLLLAAFLVQDATGSRVQMGHRKNSKDYGILPAEREENPTRLLIGSVAPTCTYNECKECRFKCRAEQVPVEGNDPINSAYHYKCVCHR